MKRVVIIPIIIASGLLLAGCNGSTENTNNPNTTGSDLQFGAVVTPTPVPFTTPKPAAASPSSVTIPGQTFLGTATPPANPSPQNTQSAVTEQQKAQPMATSYPDVTELKIEDEVVGTGDEAVSGKKVTVHYDGYLTNGGMFDSSRQRGTPFSFNLGGGQVIQGWDQGVAGMKVGGKRRLMIPPNLGYGAQGAGQTIPPNATLIFDVELLKVE
jgi:FKBP-type peptidyl-prolyl cis-trans isomerase FkpA